VNLRSALRSAFVGDEARSSNLSNPSSDLIAALEGIEGVELGSGAGGSSVAGKRITPSSALSMLAVYACVRVLAEDVGTLPLHLYGKRDEQGPNGRRRVKFRVHEDEDERARVIGEEPNPELSAQDLWQLVTGWQLLWGNAYLHKILAGDGRVRELWPLRPDRVTPFKTTDGELMYELRLENGQREFLFADEVIHLRAFGTSSNLGISPIGVARQAIGIALAAEEYAGRFWSNDARPGGVLYTDQPIGDKEYERAQRRWRGRHQGLDKSHLMALLDNGVKWQDVGVPPGDAQFIETRKFQVREIARLYRVPPYKIADLEAGSVSYKSVEVQQIDYLQTALQPWLKRIEQGAKRGVFGSELDRAEGLYPEFVRAALLMGTTKERYEAHEIAIRSRFLLPNGAA